MGLLWEGATTAAVWFVGGIAGYAGWQTAKKIDKEKTDQIMETASATGQMLGITAKAAGSAAVDKMKEKLRKVQHTYDTKGMDRENLIGLIKEAELDVNTDCKQLRTLRRRVNKALVEVEDQEEVDAEVRSPS
jgi:hypothetical protein